MAKRTYNLLNPLAAVHLWQLRLGTPPYGIRRLANRFNITERYVRMILDGTSHPTAQAEARKLMAVTGLPPESIPKDKWYS